MHKISTALLGLMRDTQTYVSFHYNPMWVKLACPTNISISEKEKILNMWEINFIQSKQTCALRNINVH